MDTNSFRQTKPRRLTEDELTEVAQLNSPLMDQLAAWANKQLTCSHCKKCTLRCEILQEPALDVGLVHEAFAKVTALPADEQPDAVLQLVQERPELYHALRRCCFCGYCTAPCKTHTLAPEKMREWRGLFMQAGLMPVDDSKLVMVDNEWHIFSAYRAIYGIAYPEFIQLPDAAKQGPGTVDTLFFPGCSMASYASDLMREVGKWLDAESVAWAMTDECCGSPLMSAGLFDRAEALRQKISDQINAAGIKRVLTLCPGCGEELAETLDAEVEIVPLAEVLLEGNRDANVDNPALGELAPLSTSSITFFDSCHDRFDGRHGRAIRTLIKQYLPEANRLEMDHTRKGTLCCGAGGAVASYDSDISQRRVWRVIDEARTTGAETLLTMCPTCTYTIAQACLGAAPERGIDSHHYLELLFGKEIDWTTVFAELEAMWTGEYGPWLNETFFG